MKNKWAVFVLAALAGCAADIRNVDDAASLQDSAVAIVFTPRQGVYDAKARRAILSAADGRAVGTFMGGFPDATRIAPGTYSFKVRCFDPVLASSKYADTFMLFEGTVQAGHFYELACNVMGASMVDRGTRFESVKDLLHPDAAGKLRR
jgi:hypothetical protein